MPATSNGMRLSKLFTKTTKENPADEASVNAQLLERGGFVYKNSAGIYTFLPLGWRVAGKISDIIRQEMNAIGGQEMFMPALVEKKYLDATGRWDLSVGFKVVDQSYSAKASEGRREQIATSQFVLGWTHEEVITEIANRFVDSYRDLPFAAYQIQTKFRNEPRAKSGLLRGREFIMKDLYSFHRSEEDLLKYYDIVREAYFKIFKRCGLEAYYTVAAGGDFTAQNTHEFQVLSPVGEDTIFVCPRCVYAENSEISELKNKCPKCGDNAKEEKSIEVGNIFPLGTKYSEAFGLQFADEKGDKLNVVMGSYGIGIGRTMGAAVEIYHDDKGIVWPDEIAPYRAHLMALGEPAEVREAADKIYGQLIDKKTEVLYDDRTDKSAGEKFADADLIGCPARLVVSEKTLEKDSVEMKKRNKSQAELVKIEKLSKLLNASNG